MLYSLSFFLSVNEMSIANKMEKDVCVCVLGCVCGCVCVCVCVYGLWEKEKSWLKSEKKHNNWRAFSRSNKNEKLLLFIFSVSFVKGLWTNLLPSFFIRKEISLSSFFTRKEFIIRKWKDHCRKICNAHLKIFETQASQDFGNTSLYLKS